MQAPTAVQAVIQELVEEDLLLLYDISSEVPESTDPLMLQVLPE